MHAIHTCNSSGLLIPIAQLDNRDVHDIPIYQYIDTKVTIVIPIPKYSYRDSCTVADYMHDLKQKMASTRCVNSNYEYHNTGWLKVHTYPPMLPIAQNMLL